MKIMTPDEAKKASAPHVDREILDINARLEKGERWFIVPVGVYGDIVSALVSSGWDVSAQMGPHTCSLTVTAQVSK